MMPTNKMAAFDAIAAEYDEAFSRRIIGWHQRMFCRKWLSRFLAGKGPLRILELNCGTGDDAIWLASLGHSVTATDISGAMIRESRRKIDLLPDSGEVEFVRAGFEEVTDLFRGKKFDLVFSDFSGLNCVPPAVIEKLNTGLYDLLDNDGHIAAVVFGKYNCWETLYYLVKLRPFTAFRRWGNKMISSPLKEKAVQPVYYYSIKKLRRLLNGFDLVEKHPVGLFIPPSYMGSLMERNPVLFDFLLKLERISAGWPAASPLADHVYLLLKKNG